MRPFSFVQAQTAEQAISSLDANTQAAFFAGGTTLIDLMKLDVLQPAELVDINHLPFSSIEETADGITIGANVRNSEVAHHAGIRKALPALSEALLAGASAQLRNMASTAGNLMQRTRCSYFRDVNSNCNKRVPGSGCDALHGYNRSHAILGTSDRCIAAHPSDMCVALTALDAVVATQQSSVNGNGDGKRSIPLREFYLLPGETPERETVLQAGELITHVFIPKSTTARRSHYLKVRDRASYEFALASAAVAVQVDGDIIREARVALGGVGTVPWRSPEAERALVGQPPTRETFVSASEAALSGAKPREHNEFKVKLAKETLVLALEELLQRS